MPLNPNIPLSTAEDIQSSIQHAVNEFSTVDVMGSLINNRKFKAGYDDFAQGLKTEKSYIWEALSAVSQDLGQSLYENIRDYIDNVSNVDTCKVRALKSMMKIAGSDYNVLDKIGYYPLEIQNLIDILSISKKKLLNNKYIKQDFLDSCVEAGVAVSCSPQDLLDPYAASHLSDESFLSVGAASSSNDYYKLQSSEAFDGYLSGVYANFIYDMLALHGTGLCSNVELYKTGFLSGIYGLDAAADDPYLSAKLKMNINVNFNVEQVVNDIDMGIDSLGNYSGDELNLLMQEVVKRRSPEPGLSCQDLATRYMYYRKQKVLEYAEFVDNMVFLPVNFSKYTEYQYDKSYLTMLSDAHHSTCISSDESGTPVIVSAYVEYAAMSLAQITKYISKIRETVKLQARKVFMKGTNNLLQYTANEFLIDYIDSLKSTMPFSKISSFVQKLSAHNVNDIAIQEYWDLTEYMNLSTSTSKFASNSSMVNDRYFDQTFTRVNGQLVPKSQNIFTNEELNHFYLDELNLANTLQPALSGESATSLSSNLYEFLSAIFDVAANTAYYNGSSTFGMKLPNNIITEDINNDLSTAKRISADVSRDALSAGYTFDGSQPISAQVDEFERAVYSTVQDIGRAGISSTYDEYSPIVDNVKTSLMTLTSDFAALLTSTYSSYFCKSSSIYSYNTDGSYMFDYFIGNPQYSIDNSYVMSSSSARDWISDDHCFTFALSTAIDNLSDVYDSCSIQIESIINIDLDNLDFIDPKSSDLESEMNSIHSFVNSKISQRTSYLQSALQDLKDQAAQAKQQHDAINSTFSSILASMPALPHQDFYMQGCDAGKGQYRIVDSYSKDKYLKASIYDAVSQASYTASTTYGTYNKVLCPGGAYLDELVDINPSWSLETQIAKCIGVFDTIGNISFGPGTTSSRSIGTQKSTLQSLQASISKITSSTLPSIADQLSEVFGVSIDKNAVFTGSCIQQIENVIKFLNTQVSDQQFNGDVVMQKYYETLSKLNTISCEQYMPAKSQYEALWTEFETFFIDYAKGSDYKSFVPYNLNSIDSYRKTKDAVALNNILNKLDELDAQYGQLQQQFIDMCNDNTIKLYSTDMQLHRYIYSGDALERCLDDFTSKMEDDIEIRDAIASDDAIKATDSIQEYEAEVQRLYKKYFPHKIQYEDDMEYSQKFNAMLTAFTDVIDDIVKRLEYSDEYEYTYSKDFFRNYSGVPSIATDPYYNIKNQTHPSFQIHPFMWNFIEWHPYDSVIDQISKTVADITYDMLDTATAASSIDKLIGQFGNVIDVWRNNVYDFTGYSTKYEQSNHMCQYTGKWSEVVGYEGAFYPPALDEYVTQDLPTTSSLSAYYSHLNLSSDQDAVQKIDNAMSSSMLKIIDIASMHLAQDVYDIYKLYVDAYDNTYILYKRYASQSPSEQEKLSTPGELWIRLADTPLAFPMSCVIEDDSSQTLRAFSENGFCDMCMFDSGYKVVMTGLATKSDVQSKPLYITYDVDDAQSPCGVGHLALIATNPRSSSVDQSDTFPEHSSSTHYMYLGSMSRDTQDLDVIYIQCTAEGKIPDDPQVRIYGITSENARVDAPLVVKLDGLSGIGDVIPVIAKHMSEDQVDHYVDLMFAASNESLSDVIESQTYELSAGSMHDAEGYLYNDPVHSSMNSLDLVEDKLVIKSIPVDTGRRYDSTFQTNTDMGYIPSYTYGKYENVLDIDNELSSSHQMVELLGKSKDLKKLIDSTNTNSDPYVTKKSLYQKYMYGRIYEDDGISSYYDYSGGNDSYPGQWLVDDFDKSVNVYSNWSMYENMPHQYAGDYIFNYVDGHYQWTICLDKKYSYEKLRNLRLFMYTTASLGRNPYVIADMADVIDQSESLPENEFLSTNYNASGIKVTTYSFNDGSFTVTMTGTQNGIDEVDSYFSNALPNISNFKYKYSTLGGGFYLKLDFELKDPAADGYLDKDIIKVALIDTHDLSFFNWCHFIDPGFTFEDFSRVMDRLGGTPLLSSQLASIDFSQYDYLSDIQVNGVQIFETSERLQFKIDESDFFSVSSLNYYVPSLNSKYPLTFAHAFEQLYDIQDEVKKHSVSIYKPDEVFMLNVADADIMYAIQNIEMQYDDVIDEYRVYEDYFYEHTDGVDNNMRFPSDDPFFYQYVHFVSPSSGVLDGQLSVSQSSCVDVRIDHTGSGDRFSRAVAQLGVDPMHGEDYRDSREFMRDFDFASLPDDQKQAVVDHAKKFMTLHMSYDKEASGIVLYANYQNYISSPYIKLVDGLPYMAVIDGTYCKVMPGDSQMLNIMIQFKQYISGVLMGVSNIVVATFKIYNVSDDKPKFVIERMSQLQ